MACSSCAKKAQMRNARFASKKCKYSFAELQSKLSVAITENNSEQVNILTNAINMYSTDCNKYVNQIQ